MPTSGRPRHGKIVRDDEPEGLSKTLSRSTNVRLLQLVVASVSSDALRPADVALAGHSLIYGKMVAPRGRVQMATYSDVEAPFACAIIRLGRMNAWPGRPPVVADAHRAGLQVVAWTFRPENVFLAADYRNGDAPEARNELGSVAEMRCYLETGVDGPFSDDSAFARRVIRG